MAPDDFGPYRGHPQDPRTPEPDLAFDELSPDEQRALLNELPHDELLEQAIALADDARMWHGRYIVAKLEAHRLRAKLAQRDEVAA